MLDKTPTNAEGNAHGYWQIFYNTGNLAYKGYCINGMAYGLDIDNINGRQNIIYHAR